MGGMNPEAPHPPPEEGEDGLSTVVKDHVPDQPDQRPKESWKRTLQK